MDVEESVVTLKSLKIISKIECFPLLLYSIRTGDHNELLARSCYLTDHR